MKSFDTDKFIKNVFLHGKNADERLFDLILRSITFIVILLFVVFFSTVKVHADNIDIFDYIVPDNEEYNLVPYWWNEDYIRMKNIFPDIPYNSNYPLPTVLWKNVKVTDRMDFDNYQFVMCCNSGSGGYESIFVVFIPKDVQVALIDSQRIYFSEECECPYVWTDFSHQNDTSYYQYRSTTFLSGLNAFNSSNILSSGSLSFFFGNIPYLKGSNVDAESYFENGNDLYTCYNANYFMYDDLAKLPDTDDGEHESNLNHLYFKDVQIALSGSTNKTSLESASAVIGVDVDNWVKNNLDDFTMDVTYQWIGKYRGLSSFEYTSSYSHPCATFLNDIYSFSLAQSMIDSGFYDHAYTHMKENYDFRSTDAVITGLKSFSGRLIQILTLQYDGSSFSFPNSGGSDNATSILDYFYLDVSVTIHADNVSSGVFTKRFDFLRGTESIMNSDGLRNNNPWLGEVDPNNPNNVDPYQNNTGSSGSGGGATANATVGDINISTGNGYQDTELHQLTEMDIQRNHIKIIQTIDMLRDAFDRLASENEDNGFVGMIRAEYDYIPGVDYILDAIVVICAICIIAFFIRIVF